MFLDESACNKHTGDRKYGWAPIGEIAMMSEPLKYTEKFSVLPLYTENGYIAWDILKGSYDTDKFNEFMRNHVIPRISPFLDTRSVLVMNNCGIHRNEVPLYIFNL